MRRSERLARLHAVVVHFLGQIGYWEEVRKRREAAGREAEAELRHTVGQWLKLINREVRHGLKVPKRVLAVKKLVDWEMIRAEGERMLKRAYLDILIIEASKVGGFAKQFDVLNVEAVEWAAANAGSMVTGILDETVDAIRAHTVDAIAQGKTVFQLTEELKPLAGLNKAQTAAASNYYTKLQTMPKYRKLTPARREAMFNKYANRMHQLRAETIARTESARAVHEGTLMRYEKLGVERVQYLAAPDACEQCATLDGRVYKLVDFPELPHPNCRCSMTPAERAPAERRIDFHENITATETEAIKSYTWFDDYEHHRKYLTGGDIERAALKRELGAKEYRRISTEAEKLNNLFVKYKDGAQSQIIHRGMAVKDWQYEFVKSKYKPGDVAKVGDGISSWSSSIRIADRFAKGKHGVVFHLEKGRKFVDELDIGKFSRMLHEKEVLVKTEEFKIIKMTEKKIGKNLRLDIYLKEIKTP